MSICSCKEPAYDHRGWCAACDKWMYERKPEAPRLTYNGSVTSTDKESAVEASNKILTDAFHGKFKAPTAKAQAPGAMELWIYNNSLGAAFVFKEKQSLPNLHGEFHVIEYAVYEATYQENVSLKTRISDMSAAHEALERELAAVNAAHDELLSYLPKVPTEPYEKELAQQLTQARTELAKFVKFDAFLKDDGDVTAEVYEAAVKGRQDFRNALREERAKSTALVGVLDKIVAHDKRLPDFTDNPQTIIASEALKKYGGGE